MKYLIQFLDDWIDFRITELISLLEINGYNAIDVIFRWRFQDQEISEEELLNQYQQFLLQYREIVLSPTENESEATKELIKSPKHFMIVQFPQAVDIPTLFKRVVLVKAIYELWANDETIEGLIGSLQSLPPSFINPVLESKLSWSIQIESFGRTFTMENKQYLRQFLSFLQFQGEVSLRAPQLEFWLILDYLSESIDKRITAKLNVNDSEYLQNILQKHDAQVYFGRKVFDNTEMKKILHNYNLKKRLYIGPTSLDHVLSMVLANIAKITPGTIAYEPFMGTGSIAIALEHFGCFCLGSDIDPRVLRGEMYAGYSGSNRQEINQKLLPSSSSSSTPPPVTTSTSTEVPPPTPEKETSEENKKPVKKSYNYRTEYHPRKVNGDVRSNFQQYSLPIPDLIRMDHHLLNRHFHESVLGNFFDVIVTDPPYGIRAGARKSGKKEEVTYTVTQEKRVDHIPSTQSYPVEEVMLDLLHTAAETLRLGGLLVYLIPTAYNFELKDLPLHPCLSFIDICHQPLSARHGRRAVVMKKVRNYTAELKEEYKQYKERVMSGQDDGFGLLLKKLITALSADAFENDTVVKRVGSCCERRKESRARRNKLKEEGVTYPVKNPHPKLGKKAQKKHAAENNEIGEEDNDNDSEDKEEIIEK